MSLILRVLWVATWVSRPMTGSAVVGSPTLSLVAWRTYTQSFSKEVSWRAQWAHAYTPNPALPPKRSCQSRLSNPTPAQHSKLHDSTSYNGFCCVNYVRLPPCLLCCGVEFVLNSALTTQLCSSSNAAAYKQNGKLRLCCFPSFSNRPVTLSSAWAWAWAWADLRPVSPCVFRSGCFAPHYILTKRTHAWTLSREFIYRPASS